MKIGKIFRFEAAHYLPLVESGHPCSRIHGHSYKLEIILDGDIDPDKGWLIDFGDIKKAWKNIEDKFDHRELNELFDNPTVELMAVWIHDTLKNLSEFSNFKILIRLWETETSYAEYGNLD